MLKKYGILKMLGLPAIESKHTVSNDYKKMNFYFNTDYVTYCLTLLDYK